MSTPPSVGETTTDRPSAVIDPRRVLDWRRLAGPSSVVALVAVLVAAVGTAYGTVMAGRLAETPTRPLVALLALCVVGAAIVDTLGKVLWVAICDRAEGRLRRDLLAAAWGQPLHALNEQAVGEILDRIDGDTHDVGSLARWQFWMMFRTLLGMLPMWVVAGLTWWPAWLLLPLLTGLTLPVIRPLLPEIAHRKVAEEAAWTDHAAILEEGIAARDDIRTSLGQAHVVHRLARLSAAVHARVVAVLRVETTLIRRSGLVLHAMLAGIAVAGVAVTATGTISVARLVTLFLVTSTFVGLVALLAEQLPEIQAGLGAVIRLRQMLAVPAEPVGGAGVPDTPALGVDFRDLDFSYEEGAFALRGVNLEIAAGTTVALVGRTGSGKSTLASLLSRSVEPAPGTVLLGGADVCDLDLNDLRATVGVVTQRTEILAGTLAENITLFRGDSDAAAAAVAELGLMEWVDGLPDGVETLLGPGGISLSAGEEQLVAFARLLVRDVRVVVLDEATARMDPVTEHRVVSAADRLLAGRTGILIAHRLSTIHRADTIAVLDRGRIVQQGNREALSTASGPFRDLLAAGQAEEHQPSATEPDQRAAEPAAPTGSPQPVAAVTGRRTGPPPPQPEVGTGPRFARGIAHVLRIRPQWGITAATLFFLMSVVGAQGAVTGLLWGRIVEALQAGRTPWVASVLLVGAVLLAPILIADAYLRFPRWWVEVMLRVRMAVLYGQTGQVRLTRSPPGEVVARALDADRYARYGDRWFDFVSGMVVAGLAAALARTWLAGAVLVAVLVSAAAASTLGRPIAGRTAAAASTLRAAFGRSLVSALDAARTVKLAAATDAIQGHLDRVDTGRVGAAVREHRVQAVLDGVPTIMVQSGVVAAWAVHLVGGWGLATTLLVANAVAGFDWYGRVAGLVVTEAPGTRAWQEETARLAGGVDLMDLPPGVDLVTGAAPAPPPVTRVPLTQLRLRGFDAVHDDGTIGVRDADLTVERGELVLLVGQVGAGKSSLLASLAGLISHRGELLWNGAEVDDEQRFMRPGQVSYVAQVPRVMSGSFVDNVRLGHDRAFDDPIGDARMQVDVEEAGGRESLVGHRGVRLSGGQVQRLALARALATDAELLLADDISSALDAITEVELWETLRRRGTTVIGSTAKRAALARADKVVVLVDGEIAAVGPWRELSITWGRLAG